MITHDPYSIPRLYKAATSFVNRNGETVEIDVDRKLIYNVEQLVPAQQRHLDPNDDFSVYDDMDVTITLNEGTDRERTQLITVPSPAKQWRYWHRRMNGGD